MAKFIRYAIAAIFFAASVGCLALWAWSSSASAIGSLTLNGSTRRIVLEAGLGYGFASYVEIPHTGMSKKIVRFRLLQIDLLIREIRDAHRDKVAIRGEFGSSERGFYFPLWYPAIIFALAGVAVLRFRRQFSIRTALIWLAVVAALLGMVVAL